MKRSALPALALGLAAGALFVTGITWMRDFTHWRISSEALSAGAIALGALCFFGVTPTRRAALTATVAVLMGFAIQAAVIMLPVWFGLVPNTVAYFNQANQQAAFACFVVGPYLAVGAVIGLLARAWVESR